MFIWDYTFFLYNYILVVRNTWKIIEIIVHKIKNYVSDIWHEVSINNNKTYFFKFILIGIKLIYV